MKMFMKILISTFVVSFLLSMIPFESTCKQLEKDVLRLHIIANSDSVVDQNLKLLVRDSVQDTISPLYNDANSKADALKITAANLDLVESVAQNAILITTYLRKSKTSFLILATTKILLCLRGCMMLW